MPSHFLVCREPEQLLSTKNVTSVLKPTLFTCLRTRNLSILLYDKMKFQGGKLNLERGCEFRVEFEFGVGI